MISRPQQVKAVGKFSIWIKFEDNSEGFVDLSHLKDLPVFLKWQNTSFFEQVFINNETFAISWDESIELCPDNMYLKVNGLTFEQWKNQQYAYATNK